MSNGNNVQEEKLIHNKYKDIGSHRHACILTRNHNGRLRGSSFIIKRKQTQIHLIPDSYISLHRCAQFQLAGSVKFLIDRWLIL